MKFKTLLFTLIITCFSLSSYAAERLCKKSEVEEHFDNLHKFLKTLDKKDKSLAIEKLDDIGEKSFKKHGVTNVHPKGDKDGNLSLNYCAAVDEALAEFYTSNFFETFLRK